MGWRGSQVPQLPHPFVQMIGYLSSFAALGFGVRVYQLAILKRNIFSNLGGHALSMGAFTGLGYYCYNLKESQLAQLADKKDQLLRMREREAHLDELKQNAGGDAHHH
ncbi:hypothetical protein MNV49_005737 [Pseudohyphozyma bogoriensis]|nr:hypothetical protein MNV49_005737 [Pseudohyphozyma bogoriensis]